MKFKEYRDWRPKYSQYEKHEDLVYDLFTDNYRQWSSIVGLAAEAGELLALAQKSMRKKQYPDRTKVVDELGDVLWYMCYVMDTFDISMDELTDFNKKKLDERNKEVK